jgi:hypothetical protein
MYTSCCANDHTAAVRCTLLSNEHISASDSIQPNASILCAHIFEHLTHNDSGSTYSTTALCATLYAEPYCYVSQEL